LRWPKRPKEKKRDGETARFHRRNHPNKKRESRLGKKLTGGLPPRENRGKTQKTGRRQQQNQRRGLGKKEKGERGPFFGALLNEVTVPKGPKIPFTQKTKKKGKKGFPRARK